MLAKEMSGFFFLLSSDLLSTFRDLSWTIRFETDRNRRNSPLQIDHIIIHPDYENYQNDIGRILPMKKGCFLI